MQDPGTNFVRAALAASIFVEPFDHGLTEQELSEVGERHSIRPGQLRDALAHGQAAHGGFGTDHRYRPPSVAFSMLLYDGGQSQPFVPAGLVFDFVVDQFKRQAKEVGMQRAVLPASTVVARGEAARYERHDLQVALAVLIGAEMLVPKAGALAPRGNLATTPPFAGREERRPPPFVVMINDVLPTVRDVISRRSDGRPASADPIRSFAEQFPGLGYPHLKHWWTQISGELSRADEQLSPVTVIVLSAALGEAALTCVVSRAQVTGTTMTKGVPDKPQQWKFETLIDAAKTGLGPILDGRLGERCKQLNDWRQRIHVARFLDKTASEVDYRVEEARTAKETVAHLVRAVLDWLARNPAP